MSGRMQEAILLRHTSSMQSLHNLQHRTAKSIRSASTALLSPSTRLRPDPQQATAKDPACSFHMRWYLLLLQYFQHIFLYFYSMQQFMLINMRHIRIPRTDSIFQRKHFAMLNEAQPPEAVRLRRCLRRTLIKTISQQPSFLIHLSPIANQFH